MMVSIADFLMNRNQTETEVLMADESELDENVDLQGESSNRAVLKLYSPLIVI